MAQTPWDQEQPPIGEQDVSGGVLVGVERLLISVEGVGCRECFKTRQMMRKGEPAVKDGFFKGDVCLNQLHVAVGLAGAGERPAVVKPQGVGAVEAHGPGLKVREGEGRCLGGEGASADEEMGAQDRKLVEQANMGGAGVGDIHRGVIG